MKMSSFEKLFVNSQSHSQQVSRRAEELLHRIPFEAGQRYLDVGCGNGAASIYLAQMYSLAVTGVDVDPDQIRLAEEASHDLDHARFLTVDSTQLPFEDSEFDIVFTNKVMHHIPAWEMALAEMVRVLRPWGHLIYADLVYPPWLASVGEAIAANQFGFPTYEALETFFAESGLYALHTAHSLTTYEGVFQKRSI